MAKRRTKRTPTRRAATGGARSRSSSSKRSRPAARKRKKPAVKRAPRRRSSARAARKVSPVTRKAVGAPVAPAPQQHVEAEPVREPGPGWWSALPKRATPARRAAAAGRNRPRGERPETGPGTASVWPLAFGAIVAPQAEAVALPRPPRPDEAFQAGLPLSPPVVEAPVVAAPVLPPVTTAVFEAVAPVAAPGPAAADAALEGVEERDRRMWDSSNAVGDIGPEGAARAQAPAGDAPQGKAGEESPQKLLHELDQAIAQDVSTLLHGAYESVEELLESALDAPPVDEKVTANVGAEEQAIATIAAEPPAAKREKRVDFDLVPPVDEGDEDEEEEEEEEELDEEDDEEPDPDPMDAVDEEAEPQAAAAPQKPPRAGAPAKAEKPGRAMAFLQWVNTPLRFLPPSVRLAVDWVAISLLVWAPIVWLVTWLVIGR